MGLPWETLRAVVTIQPEEHLFVTVSGAHLHGYPSAESDIDLRGCHRLPTDALFALERPSETVERLEMVADREVETVSHEVEKYLRLMLKRNGAVLEQIFSPLVVVETPAFGELRELARGCITRGLYHHYRSAMQSTQRAYRQATVAQREGRGSVKLLLALYRLPMTAIAVLRAGEVETSLPRLNEAYGFPYIDELIECKMADESATLSDDTPYLADLERLSGRLDEAYAASSLPETPSNRAAIDAFLYRQRWEGLAGGAK